MRTRVRRDGESKRSQKMDLAVEVMPELRHNSDRGAFSYGRSEVMQWMLEMSEEELEAKLGGPRGALWEAMLNWVFQAVSRRGVIVFDGRKWRGAGSGYTERRVEKVEQERQKKLRAAALANPAATGPGPGRFEVQYSDDEVMAKLLPSYRESKSGHRLDLREMAKSEVVGQIEAVAGCSKATAWRILRRLRARGLLLEGVVTTAPSVAEEVVL